MAASSLEARLERSKRRGNLRLQEIERFRDKGSVAELYLQGRVGVHVHVPYLPSQATLCWEYFAQRVYCRDGRPPDRAVRDMGVEGRGARGVSELAVLVWVGEVGKELRPVASTTRLQNLDRCLVFGQKATEEDPPVSRLVASPLEALGGAFDGELGAILLAAGVAPRQLVDQVVEGRAEVVDGLSDDDGHTGRGLAPLVPVDVGELSLWVEIVGQVIQVTTVEPFGAPLEISEVDIRSRETSVGSTEGTSHEVPLDHDREEGTDAEDRQGLRDPRPDARSVHEPPAQGGEGERLNARPSGEARARWMRPDLAAIGLPTLLMRGQLSRSLNAMSAADAISCLPDGELVTILRAGHTVQGDNPKEFSRALDAFLVRRLGLEG